MYIYRKILVIFLAFIFLGLIPNNILKADTNFVTIEAFDTYPAGEETGTNSYLTWESTTSDGVVTSSVYNSPPNSLRMKQTSSPFTDVWLNMTTDLEYNGMEFKYRCSGFTSNTNFNMFFYNDTGVALINFYFNITTVPTIYVYDDTIDTMMFFVHTYSWNTWYTIGMQNNHSATSPINSVYFYFKNSTGVILYDIEIPIDGIIRWEDELLSEIKIDEASNANNHYYYFDDFKITQDNFATTDISNYLQYCEGAIYHHKNIPNRYLETKSNTKLTGTVQYLDLWINTLQLTLISDTLTDYTGYLNGYNIGSPDSIVNQIGAEYSLRWENLNIDIDDDYLVLEFYSADHYTISGTSYYWYNLPYGNKQGIYGFGIHDDNTKYGNGVYNYNTEQDGDIRYCVYYEYEEIDETDCGYDDNLVITFPNGKYIYDNVYVDYKLESTTNTFIKVYFPTEGFSITHSTLDCSGSFDFTTLEEGVYEVEINRSGVDVYNELFWISDNVTSTFNDSVIWSDKYRIEVEEVIRINWKYNFTKYGYGSIITSKYLTVTNDFNYILPVIDGSNEYEGIYHSYSTSGKYYLHLGYFDNGTFNRLNSKIIWVGDGTTTTNIIYTDKSEYDQQFYLSLGRYSAKVFIMGEHAYVGQNVYIDINNGQFKYNVGTYTSFTRQLYFRTGTYYVNLILNDDGVLTNLANCTFKVNPLGSEDDPVNKKNPGDDDQGRRFGIFNKDNLMLAGFIILILFTFVLWRCGITGLPLVIIILIMVLMFSVPGYELSFFPPIILFLTGFILILLLMYTILRR